MNTNTNKYEIGKFGMAGITVEKLLEKLNWDVSTSGDIVELNSPEGTTPITANFTTGTLPAATAARAIDVGSFNLSIDCNQTIKIGDYNYDEDSIFLLIDSDNITWGTGS